MIDEKEFEKSREFWREQCNEVLRKNNQLNDWEFWLEAKFPNSEDFSNIMVYSLKRHDRLKGLTIDQQVPMLNQKWEVLAYVKEYNIEADEFWASEYLVFACNLTKETAKIFKALFNYWIRVNVDKDKMEKYIDKLGLS